MRPRTSFEPRKRIDPDKFAGRNETAQHGRGPAAIVAAKECPVVTPHCKAPQRSLGCIVIDQQVAVGTVPRQRRPVLQRVGDGRSGVAAGDPFKDGFPACAKRVQARPQSLPPIPREPDLWRAIGAVSP